MVHHPRGALHLAVDAGELVDQVVDLYVAVAEALEDIDDGHAYHVQRLVELMGQAGGHFTEGGHFRALCELLLRASYLGVVASYGLDLEQASLFVEYPAIGPDPPGVFAPGQLQVDLGGADRKLRAQLVQPPGECLALFPGHPVAQIHPRQLLGRQFQIGGQRAVAEGQGQVRLVAADHRRRVFHQNSVAFLTLPDLLGRQGRFGDVQPQAHGFHRQAEVVAQQFRFIQQPVIVTLTVAQPIAGAHRVFTQQPSRALEILQAVVGVYPLHQRPGCAVGQGPAEQREQAVAKEHRLQSAFVIALYINHRR
ncbi:hypothetical protein D3C86_1012370 [compost metagenome]